MIARIGIFTASPTTNASPVRRIGSIENRPLRLSEAQDVTWARSESLVRRRAIMVPHCERIVGSTSEGRWLTSINPTPYFLPSFAMRLAAVAARLFDPAPRYTCASSNTTRSGLSRPPSGFNLPQNRASYRIRSTAPTKSSTTAGGTPDKSNTETAASEPTHVVRSLSRSDCVAPSFATDHSPGLNRNCIRGSWSLLSSTSRC